VDNPLAPLRSDDVVQVINATFTFLAGMVVWLTLQWRLHRRTEIETAVKRAELGAALKQTMLNRGMSAAEIERVVRAPLGGDGSAGEAGAVSREIAPHVPVTA
jgi:hypothetical protein